MIIRVLMISISLAIVALLYNPPQRAYSQMLDSLNQEPFYSINLSGQIKDNPFQANVIKSSDLFMRLSYPPLKLINNQWMKFDDNSVGLFKVFKPIKRMGIKYHDGRFFDRYEFVLEDGAVFEQIPLLKQGKGEIWLGYWDKLPYYINLEIPEKSEIELVVEYAKSNEKIANSRSISDVVKQLNSVEKLSALAIVPLIANPDNEKSFYHDFDQDGLSDALEIFYGADPANSDTDSDTFLDGDEVARGYNPAGEGRLTD